MLNEKNQEKKYTVFNIGLEKFGIESSKIEEIALCQDAIAMPGNPSVIEGIINLRGSIIPVFNLRKNYSVPAAVITERTRIIIVAADCKSIGIIVDNVAEEIMISNSIIEEPDSAFSLCLQHKYIGGVAKSKSDMIILINLKEVIDEL